MTDKTITKIYREKSNCGDMSVKIVYSKSNLEMYLFEVKMKKFGTCSAYEFINDKISNDIHSGVFTTNIIENLKKYGCKKKKGKENNGCIKIIGRCLEKFVNEHINK